MLSEWSPGCYWTCCLKHWPRRTIWVIYIWETYLIITGLWVNNIQQYTKWHIAIWHFLQDVISMLNTHIEAAVKAPSQSVLIDYTFGALSLNTFKLQRKSNHHVVYSKTLTRVCSYHNSTKIEFSNNRSSNNPPHSPCIIQKVFSENKLD